MHTYLITATWKEGLQKRRTRTVKIVTCAQNECHAKRLAALNVPPYAEMQVKHIEYATSIVVTR